jgi:hypothetical protein
LNRNCRMKEWCVKARGVSNKVINLIHLGSE